MCTKRKKFFLVCLILVALLASYGCSPKNQQYPNHTIELVVPSSAGGGQDTLCRLVQPILEKDFKVSVRVTNVSGGAHTKGIIYTQSAPADGYTVHNESPSGILADIFKKMPFRFQDEFVPVCRMQADTGVIWAGANGRFKTIQEMIAFAQANPGKVTVTIASPGGVDDAGVGMFAAKAGIQLAVVPTEDAGERMASVIGGHVDMMYEEVSAVGDMAASGNLKPLVVLRDTRIDTPELKDTPAAGELGIMGMASFGTWRAFFVRKGTPQEVIDKLVAEFKKIYDSSEYQTYAKANALDITPGWLGPEELGKLVAENNESFTEVFTSLGRL